MQVPSASYYSELTRHWKWENLPYGNYHFRNILLYLDGKQKSERYLRPNWMRYLLQTTSLLNRNSVYVNIKLWKQVTGTGLCFMWYEVMQYTRQ
jgi:hypothetical protein